MARTWFITGAARGIGAEIVKAALAVGDQVVAAGRDPAGISEAFAAPPERLFAVRLDVAEPGQAESAVAAAAERFDGVDILVNNAGYGQLGAFEENEPADIARQFAVNVFGLFDVTRAVLPLMRRRRSGRIFNITSVAGFRGGPGASLYSASKFAVEGFSESLALELAQFGIAVTIVEPGAFRTGFLDDRSIRYGRTIVADYAEHSANLRAIYGARNRQQAGDPARLASTIVDLAGRDKPPLRFVAGSDAVGMLETKIDNLRSELAAWRALSVATDGAYDSSVRVER
jgi:NAD(P)-dependent dehydrogenase (short-subunit alcohol dehydrogenase family)